MGHPIKTVADTTRFESEQKLACRVQFMVADLTLKSFEKLNS